MNEFSDWLNSKLTGLDWTQADLARASGLTRATISYYLGPKSKKPDEDALRKIAKAFKLPEETVFTAAGIMKPTYDPNLDKDPSLLEWIKIFKDADQQTRDTMLDNARYFSNRGTQKR